MIMTSVPSRRPALIVVGIFLEAGDFTRNWAVVRIWSWKGTDFTSDDVGCRHAWNRDYYAPAIVSRRCIGANGAVPEQWRASLGVRQPLRVTAKVLGGDTARIHFRGRVRTRADLGETYKTPTPFSDTVLCAYL
jgi:hypothetical protein